jgi:hypothetical protein
VHLPLWPGTQGAKVFPLACQACFVHRERPGRPILSGPACQSRQLIRPTSNEDRQAGLGPLCLSRQHTKQKGPNSKVRASFALTAPPHWVSSARFLGPPLPFRQENEHSTILNICRVFIIRRNTLLLNKCQLCRNALFSFNHRALPTGSLRAEIVDSTSAKWS